MRASCGSSAYVETFAVEQYLISAVFVRVCACLQVGSGPQRQRKDTTYPTTTPAGCRRRLLTTPSRQGWELKGNNSSNPIVNTFTCTFTACTFTFTLTAPSPSPHASSPRLQARTNSQARKLAPTPTAASTLRVSVFAARIPSSDKQLIPYHQEHQSSTHS